MVSLQGLGLSDSVVATRIMTSALLDDIGSLVMVAIVVPVAAGTESLIMTGLLFTVGASVFHAHDYCVFPEHTGTDHDHVVEAALPQGERKALTWHIEPRCCGRSMLGSTNAYKHAPQASRQSVGCHREHRN